MKNVYHVIKVTPQHIALKADRPHMPDLTLTYIPRLARVKVDPYKKIKVKGQTVQVGEHKPI